MIARVFPRRTNCTPDDAYAFVGEPPPFPAKDITEVMVSCLFTWDRAEAERLGALWAVVAPVRIGGPAFDSPALEFTPGMFVKNGYTVTSRGCPNSCWFCSVPKREGKLRELAIRPGWNILDSNILACSPEHIDRVFAMLKTQNRSPEFTGGLEAKLLTPSTATKLKAVKPKQLFFAYDSPDDFEPLQEAGRILLNAGFTRASHTLRCYVLCGWQNDTIEKARIRMIQTVQCGFTPMAMLYRDQNGEKPGGEWPTFQRFWVRPALMHQTMKEIWEIL